MGAHNTCPSLNEKREVLQHLHFHKAIKHSNLRLTALWLTARLQIPLLPLNLNLNYTSSCVIASQSVLWLQVDSIGGCP